MMKNTINQRSRINPLRNIMAMAISAWLGIIAWNANACVADGENLIRTGSRVYSGFNAGDVIADWASIGSATFLHKCSPDQAGEFRVAATEASVGSKDGYEVFPTSNDNIGMQVRYRYPEARYSNGEQVWSSWQGLAEAGEIIHVVTHIGGDLYTEYVIMDIELRFIALSDISGDQYVGRSQIMQVDDESFGTTLHQKTFEAFNLWAPVEASCWFTALPSGSKVELPEAYSMALGREGAMSAPASFTWSWKCDAGNQGHSGEGDFKYLPLNPSTDLSSGRMSVTGGAKGVDLLVTTRRGGGGTYVPVQFDKWYGGSLGSEGTEYLQVRYVRNADPDLVIGSANGGITIRLEPL